MHAHTRGWCVCAVCVVAPSRNIIALLSVCTCVENSNTSSSSYSISSEYTVVKGIETSRAVACLPCTTIVRLSRPNNKQQLAASSSSKAEIANGGQPKRLAPIRVLPRTTPPLSGAAASTTHCTYSQGPPPSVIANDDDERVVQTTLESVVPPFLSTHKRAFRREARALLFTSGGRPLAWVRILVSQCLPLERVVRVDTQRMIDSGMFSR